MNNSEKNKYLKENTTIISKVFDEYGLNVISFNWIISEYEWSELGGNAIVTIELGGWFEDKCQDDKVLICVNLYDKDHNIIITKSAELHFDSFTGYKVLQLYFPCEISYLHKIESSCIFASKCYV